MERHHFYMFFYTYVFVSLAKTHFFQISPSMFEPQRTARPKPLVFFSLRGNPAVDNIAIGLRKEGVRAVRVGRPDKINRILEEITSLGGAGGVPHGRCTTGHRWLPE